MLDAFKNTIGIGSEVMYSPSTPGEDVYNYGTIVKLHPSKKSNGRYNRTIPDRVEIHVTKSNVDLPLKNPIVYASNVVKQ